MAFSADKENQHPMWFKSRKALNNVLFAMRRNSLTPRNQTDETVPFPPLVTKIQDSTLTDLVFSDEILLKILSKLPESQRNANFLVSKRWLNLQGRLVRSIKLLDWDFLVSGRVFLRFPNLIHVDLVNGCLVSPRNSGVSVTNKFVSFHGGSDAERKDWFFPESLVLSGDEIDKGLRVLADGCPNLRKLVVVNATEMGLLSVAEECPTLQELTLHMCNDQVLRGIAAFGNLQSLRMSGCVGGIYGSLVSDVGLIILAQGCKRLMKLELSGCRGSYEGIRAIGQCCQMLEELTLCDHEMENGWLLALSCCENLKSIRLVSCKRIDGGCEEEEVDGDLGCCSAVESLCLEKCQLRDKKSLKALFVVCQNVREVVVKNCWGLTDDMFTTATVFRRVKCLSLEGCSLLTTDGLESVIVSWKELKSLTVKACNNMKEISSVLSALKNLKWESDITSRLSANLARAGIGKRGAKFFNKSCDWKSLPGSYRTLQILETNT